MLTHLPFKLTRFFLNINLTDAGYGHPWVSFPPDLASKAALMLPPSDPFNPLLRWAEHHPSASPTAPHATYHRLRHKNSCMRPAQGQEDTKSPSTDGQVGCRCEVPLGDGDHSAEHNFCTLKTALAVKI